MGIFQEVEEHGFALGEITIYTLDRVEIGMGIQRNERAILIVHNPTGTKVFADSGKSQHASVIMALDTLVEELEGITDCGYGGVK